MLESGFEDGRIVGEKNANLSYLVVDDDECFRERLVRALRARGFSADGCESVDAAIQLMNDVVVERAIVDLKMPGKHGLELVQHVQRESLRTKVAVLTGYGSIATTMSAMKLGAVNYLTKPVSLAQILSAFEEEILPLQDVPIPTLSQVEWDHIQRVVKDCGGNVSQAAKLLGMHRRSLQRKLQKTP